MTVLLTGGMRRCLTPSKYGVIWQKVGSRCQLAFQFAINSLQVCPLPSCPDFARI